MVFPAARRLPILLRAVVVSAMSSIVHGVLGCHESDNAQVAHEDQLRAALRCATR